MRGGVVYDAVVVSVFRDGDGGLEGFLGLGRLIGDCGFGLEGRLGGCLGEFLCSGVAVSHGGDGGGRSAKGTELGDHFFDVFGVDREAVEVVGLVGVGG